MPHPKVDGGRKNEQYHIPLAGVVVKKPARQHEVGVAQGQSAFEASKPHEHYRKEDPEPQFQKRPGAARLSVEQGFQGVYHAVDSWWRR